jgi:LAS superfamily LD-carboxypeptidase LdcB
MCLGESTAGYANGFIPDSALCPLWQAPGEKLRADAAAAFNRMSQYHAATAGGPLCVTDSYRSYSGQVSLYRRKPSLAATPGTSEHGWGKAVDFCGGVERYGSNAFYWMKQNAGRFGFFHPDWAEPSGSRPEAWHWEYSG